MAKRRSPRRKRRGASGDRWIVAGIAIAAVVIALALWGPLRQRGVAPTKRPVTAERGAEHERGIAEKGPGKAVRVAIVIDDLGMDLKQAREVLGLPGRVTPAILPLLPQSRKIAALATEEKREYLLHLPMEYRGKNGINAAGMLRANMTPQQFLQTLREDLASVPGAVGVNNHEGSALTENVEAMKFLMAELKTRNLLFLDSFTTPKSVALATARAFGLRTGRRDVFLDNEKDDPKAIRAQLDELAALAQSRGSAIAIGHPHPLTLSLLRAWIPEAEKHGILLVPVSQLLQ